MHYFNGDLGREGLNEIFKGFHAKTGITVFDNPIGHEDFKLTISEMAKQKFLPDVFSYWAGARTQFIVETGSLEKLDNLWVEKSFNQLLPSAISKSASVYNQQYYLVPFGYHYSGIFYNPKILKKIGVIKPPKDWAEFLSLCKKLKVAGITPIALGAKNRWPAQFWFDYLLLRTAGADYRKDLMDGKVNYNSPKVHNVMRMWQELLRLGYIGNTASNEIWTNAADSVASGKAAMTLMGTWITGYWDSKGLKAGLDYDLFDFPLVDKNIERTSVGPVDGFLISRDAPKKELAKKFVEYVLSDLSAQKIWIKSQGALSPNLTLTSDHYSSVMKKALITVNTSKNFAFNYDLATHPDKAEKGLDMFASFLKKPNNYNVLLKQLDKEIENLTKQ